MSERDHGRRIPVNRRVRRPQHPSPSPSPSPSPLSRRRRTPVPRRSSRPVTILVLKRCHSEPALWRNGATGDDHRSMMPPPQAVDEEVLFRPQTCTDIFASSDYSLPQSPQNCFTGFNKDAKVVVNVTVEGSPGPVRTMIKLGCSVEETIRLVVRKYNDEGRTPHLDKDAATTFELHHSYFSLESLNKSDLIGTIGGRNFYLRKSSSTISVKANTCLPVSPPFIILPDFVAGKINKIMRRTRKLWKILGCLPNSE